MRILNAGKHLRKGLATGAEGDRYLWYTRGEYAMPVHICPGVQSGSVGGSWDLHHRLLSYIVV